MEDTKEKLLPGTAASYIVHGEKGFTKIDMLLEATGGLSLSQVCAVTGLEGSTIQNWVKRGWVAHPKGKKYEEVHIARILILNALKECIKLEYIALLMTYVNGATEDFDDDIISEKVLFNYLCDALQRLGQVDDLSRGGVESVVEAVIKDYSGPVPYARVKIRKALAIMIYACVCTDVKRRTEAMMGQVLRELDDPESITEEIMEIEVSKIEDDIQEETDTEGPKPETVQDKQPASAEEARKTIAQALREWDTTRVENAHVDDRAVEAAAESADMRKTDAESEKKPAESAEKPAQKPWYFRRN